MNFAQLAELVRDSVNIIDVAKWLGMEVRGNRAPCPFHEERSVGAFQFNAPGGYCHCHSCGESADAIKLTAQVKGIKPYKALIELNNAFGLSLPLDSDKPSQSQRRALNAYEKRRVRQKLRETYQNRLMNILCELCAWRRTYAPAQQTQEWDKRYVFALRELDTVEYCVELVRSGEIPDGIGAQIGAWVNEMEQVEPNLQRRKRIISAIDNYFGQFIAGEIAMNTLITKHKKAVKEFAGTK